MTKKFDDYDEKYMKMEFNSDDELPLNKMMEIPSMTIVARAIYLENNKYYPQVFLDECMYKNIKMESEGDIKEINIKNRACFYFDDIIKDIDINFRDII